MSGDGGLSLISTQNPQMKTKPRVTLNLDWNAWVLDLRFLKLLKSSETLKDTMGFKPVVSFFVKKTSI